MTSIGPSTSFYSTDSAEEKKEEFSVAVTSQSSCLSASSYSDHSRVKKHLLKTPASIQTNINSQRNRLAVHQAIAYQQEEMSQTTEPEKEIINKDSKKPPRRPLILGFLGLTVDVAFWFVLLAFAAVYCLRSVHDDYFVPIVERARRTDTDLLEEFTYYDRECNVADVTATPVDAHKLFIEYAEDAVDQMMTHGTVILPNLLSQGMIRELRQFVVEKNDAVRGTSAEYPVSQGSTGSRISYGIEGSEHPTVIKALKAIHDNHRLQELLEGLVGKNPALTEITAITSYFGAPNQVWHSDVKADGHAVKFGRTYSHSYSLFIPLQNTTGSMGATEICPGTHYCVDDQTAICKERKIGMHQVRKGEGTWVAGDAALLNQQVWHRGTKHTEPNAMERIVFIVSFIGRPNDTRQLSRGTYFHMKWNMWGHTWDDLKDAAVSMAWPFNVLRCLHIWKPRDRAWGYDLFTSAALRIGNGQQGCEPEDLGLFLTVLEDMGFPEWLDGTINLDHPEAWQIYFRETIANMFNFLLKVNAGVIGLLLLFALIATIANRSGSRLRTFTRSITRIAIPCFIVFLSTLWVLDSVRSSKWGAGISSGHTLMRPFPPSTTVWPADPSISKGSTTVPWRYDVLVGTRLDAKTIGAYSRWMDFHPGNAELLQYVADVGGPLYRSYERGLPRTFKDHLIDGAFQVINEKGGRFLQQDYRTGDWRTMTEKESLEYVRLVLFEGRKSLLAALREEVNFSLLEYRFGTLRGTTLSWQSQTNLRKLKSRLFDGPEEIAPLVPSKQVLQLRRPSLSNVDATVGSNEDILSRSSGSKRWTTFRDEPAKKFKLHDELLFRGAEGGMFRVTVVGFAEDNEHVYVSFYGEDGYYHGTVRPLHHSLLVKRIRPEEGAFVFGNYLKNGEWFPGRITRVRPDATVDILYDDGDFEERVESGSYQVSQGPAGR